MQTMERQRTMPRSMPAQPQSQMASLAKAECAVVSKTLAAHKINARVLRAENVRFAFIRYRLALMPGERIAKIDGIKRELANALTVCRRKHGINTPVKVRLSDVPLAIEVPHPSPAVLNWRMDDVEDTPPHTMLLGKSYIDSEKIERVSFDDAPHILVVGITKAGKSVLEKMMLLSLCYNTSPDDLKIVLVDLKNEDMLPFANLPHVMTFAGRHDKALEAIRWVRDEKDKRIDNPGYKPYRLVLWIDELAQLAQDKEAKEILGDIASIGRSKNINLIAATQYPTQDGGMGALMKANFPLRLVGMVAPGQSHIATGRAQAGADMLPGMGSFLYCYGPDVYRFQSFNLTEQDAQNIAGQVKKQWPGGYEVDMATGYGGGYGLDMERNTRVETEIDASISGHRIQFPIRRGRALTEAEAQAVRQMFESGLFEQNGKFSMNKAMAHVYGSKNPERAAWIREALEGVNYA